MSVSLRLQSSLRADSAALMDKLTSIGAAENADDFLQTIVLFYRPCQDIVVNPSLGAR